MKTILFYTIIRKKCVQYIFFKIQFIHNTFKLKNKMKNEKNEKIPHPA